MAEAKILPGGIGKPTFSSTDLLQPPVRGYLHVDRAIR